MRKYTLRGEEVEVISQLETGYICKTVYNDGENEYINTPTRYIKSLYDKPPVKKLHNVIISLKQQIKELMDERTALCEEQNVLIQQQKDYVSKLEKYKAINKLQRLDDILEGKITHYVFLSYTPQILTFEEAKSNYDGFKLLTLFGTSKDDLNWKLNEYKDGSGSNTKVIPCFSYEEALQILIEHVNKELASNYVSSNIISLIKNMNLPVNVDLLEQYKERRRNELRKSISDMQQSIKKIETEITTI